MLRKEILNPELLRRTSIKNGSNFQSIFDTAPIGIFQSTPEGSLWRLINICQIDSEITINRKPGTDL